MNLDLTVLSVEEAALFESLIGKLEMKKKPTKKTWGSKDKGPTIKTSLRPYKLKIAFVCKTCSHTSNVCFNMIPASDGTGLVSVRTLDMNNIDSSNTRDTWICDHCKPFLMEKEKDELVKMLLITLAAK